MYVLKLLYLGARVLTNKCPNKVDLEILWGEKYIFIRDFQSEYWNALRTGLVM